MKRAMMGSACALAALLLAGGAYAQTADQNDNRNGYTTSAPDRNNSLQNSNYNGPDNDNDQNTYQENGYNTANPDENGATYNEEPSQNVNEEMTNGEAAEYNEGTAENSPPAGTFYLTSNQQSEVADFTSDRDMSVCLSRRGNEARFNSGQERSVPLNINWNGNSAMVYPGNCLYFDASHVTVRPAEQLPPGVALHGRIETYGPYENTR